MRILIINADYPGFLRELYLGQPGLAESSYVAQMAARNASLFGVADFYSLNFKAHGHEAVELHINNPWLQHAWAREHGLGLPPLAPPPQPDTAPPSRRQRSVGTAKALLRPLKPVLAPLWHKVGRRLAAMRPKHAAGATPDQHEWERAILAAQIEDFRPDVILNQDMAYLRSPFLKTVKRPGRLIIGQIASSLPEGEVFDIYDLVISSLPNFVEWFRKRGVPAERNRLAFEPSVVARMGLAPPRDIALSFVGSLSPDHVKRIAFLEYLATRTPLKVWGNGIERLPASSPLHACYQGEAWGRDMYDILRRSKITLNFHIDLAEDWANNMRLYEATGMGPLLLTDAKRNLAEIFVPGEHVAAYTDAEDCVRQINALLADDTTRERIAAAGQRHAVATQNYFLRAGEIAALAAARL